MLPNHHNYPAPALHVFRCLRGRPLSRSPRGSRAQPEPQPGNTLSSLARSVLSSIARPCSSGGRRTPVMAFSCRSRSLATLSKPASSCRPCRSEASVGEKTNLVWQEYEAPRSSWDCGLAWPPSLNPLANPCHPYTAQSLVRPLFHVPDPLQEALVPTSRVLCP